MKPLAPLFLALALTSCAANRPMASDPWVAEFRPPEQLDTPRLHLEPLGPEHARLDYEAFMSSREHLHQTLHWGSWPSEDMTVDQNAKDLARHGEEFEKHEAYAYTVQSSDLERCVGCIYLNPVDGDPRALRMAYWVIESELANDTDVHLVDTVLAWIESDWPVDTVEMPIHVDNERGARIAREQGLEEAPEVVKDHRTFTWRR